MPKFNPIFVMKLEKEIQENRKQVKLKQKARVSETNVKVQEKQLKEYIGTVIKGILYAGYICLIFAGIAAVLNPESQQIIMNALSELLPR